MKKEKSRLLSLQQIGGCEDSTVK